MIVLDNRVLFFTGKALLAEEITLPGLPANHDVQSSDFFQFSGNHTSKTAFCCANDEAGNKGKPWETSFSL
jgi:hypothetical protein